MSSKDTANPYAGFGYDAMWAVGLSLNNAIYQLALKNKSLDDFEYNNYAIGQVILQEMLKLRFQGVSVCIDSIHS